MVVTLRGTGRQMLVDAERLTDTDPVDTRRLTVEDNHGPSSA
jgi:hypothetical protein